MDGIVWGYMFDSEASDGGDMGVRNHTVCQIVGRADGDDRDAIVFGPAFKVRFGDGYETVVYSSELSPWYAT